MTQRLWRINRRFQLCSTCDLSLSNSHTWVSQNSTFLPMSFWLRSWISFHSKCKYRPTALNSFFRPTETRRTTQFMSGSAGIGRASEWIILFLIRIVNEIKIASNVNWTIWCLLWRDWVIAHSLKLLKSNVMTLSLSWGFPAYLKQTNCSTLLDLESSAQLSLQAAPSICRSMG